MKELFDQIPHIFDQLFKKIEEMDVSGRPEVKEARNKLMQTMRETTKELSSLSEKFGQNPQPKIKPRVPAVLKRKEPQQLSFDFYKNNTNNST